jgi:hypothetical protein
VTKKAEAKSPIRGVDGQMHEKQLHEVHRTFLSEGERSSMLHPASFNGDVDLFRRTVVFFMYGSGATLYQLPDAIVNIALEMTSRS